ncbi:MAG: hypothetical protein RLZZ241_812 [Bacteroidota bacterium]|jgi:hypothetical protein
MICKGWFWLTAKNRHGIHSKFVYDFLDLALYTLPKQNRLPEQKLLSAALTHFKPKQLGVNPKWIAMPDWIAATCSEDLTRNIPYDFYVTDAEDTELKALIHQENLWSKNAVIFIGGIRRNKKNYKNWKKLCSYDVIRVSLEVYEAGLLCFRPQQAPQHFKIRLNSSIFGKL